MNRNVRLENDSEPLKYSYSTRKFKLYSTDLELMGEHELTLSARLTNYATTSTEEFAEKTTIEILDPCINPQTITVPDVNQVPDYRYTADTIIDYKIEPFETFPSFCPITYTCENEVFSCTWTSAEDAKEGYGIFDPINLTYKAMTTDLNQVKPGSYDLVITGKSGLNSAQQTITLNFVNPCRNAKITLLP